ncbi:MAG: cytochrome c biogenesis protein CcsA [Armatimonadetes bacterium]|nr:cytochrome c biogenesis protein CcsA [Armatimonadota bacterium]
MKNLLRSPATIALAGLLGVVSIVLSLAAPRAAIFPNPELARIIFFHLSSAILGSIFILVAAYHAIRYLGCKGERFDIRLESAWNIATVLCVLALTTGIIFSRAQWGAFWQWDPRQTSFLLVTLMLFAGLILRRSFDEPDKRAIAHAGYAAITLIPILFLVFVYPRLPHVVQSSFHPSTTVSQGSLDSNYRNVLLVAFAAVTLATLIVFDREIRTLTLLRRILKLNGTMETGGGTSSADGVRGPVVVPADRR